MKNSFETLRRLKTVKGKKTEKRYVRQESQEILTMTPVLVETALKQLMEAGLSAKTVANIITHTRQIGELTDNFIVA